MHQVKLKIYALGYQIISALGAGHFGQVNQYTIYIYIQVLKVKIKEGPNAGNFYALKRIDLDKFNDSKLEDMRKKMVFSNSINHKNLLSYKTTFVYGKELWIISTFMDPGSMEIILKSQYPNGIKDYNLIACILKQTLEGLEYLHQK